MNRFPSGAGAVHGRRANQHESDYEEIGPPKFRNGGPPSPAVSASIQCDLCGNPNPLVMCRECVEQNFCAACDEMYHKHPKRACHVRKPISRIAEKSQSYPKVEMPGSGPVAPPRSSRKKNGLPSAEPSPAPSRIGTLPRKPSNSNLAINPMAGRPLPPPPPVDLKAKPLPNLGPSSTPPPALPKKSASVAQMSGMMGSKSGSPSRYPTHRPQPGIPMPAGLRGPPMPGQRDPGGQWSNSSNGINPSNRHQHQATTQYPPYNNGNSQYPRNSQYPTTNQYPVSNPPNVPYPHNTQYPHGPQYPPSDTEDWGRQGGCRGHSKYLDEVRFPPKETSIEPSSTTLNRRSSQNTRNSGKGRFANRVNRSSSLHDLARARQDPSGFDQNEGVKWKDEQGMPNLPGVGMNGRTTSTKSLHVMPGDSMMWNNNAMWAGGLGFGVQGQQPFHPMMGGWGPMPNMMGQVPIGPNSLRGSMHELNKNFLRPSSPSGSQKSSRSKNSNRSKKSNKSNNSTRRSKSNRHKERSRTNSSSQSRNASRSSKKQRDRSNSSDNDDSEDFFTGESDEEFVSISSNSDKAPRVSWTCEHCTYVNNPGVKVCAMCCKTSKNSREGAQRNKDESGKNSLKRDKSKSGSKGRKNYNSSEDDSDNHNRKSKSKSKKNYSSEEESDDEKIRSNNRRGDSREKKKSSKSKGYKHSSRGRSEESDIDDDAVAAYYAVRIDKNKGMTVTQQNGSDLGRYDSSSESASAHNPMKRPNIDAPAPAKGILKKVASNPSLAKLDGMSEVSGAISEVGYITNKLTQRLKARGQHDVLDSPDIKRRTDTSSDDIWQHEKENWLRQKEELKAWAKAQGQGQGTESSHPSPKIQQAAPSREQDYMSDIPTSAGRMYRTLSGYSLADAEAMLPGARRGSEQVGNIGGKRSFRSKRFSRNLDREPSLKRAQSFHMDQREDGDLWLDSQRRTFQRATSKNSINSEHFGVRSDSSDNEEPVHFTSTVTSTTRGPGGVGSYLARQEFGSSEVQPGPDSGYVSHSSGGGYPKLLVQPSHNTIKSFTMSMDRGIHGGPPKPLGPLNQNLEFNRYRSMDDLGGSKDSKIAGFELVKILREAEKSGFTSEDVQVAVNHCGEVSPITWLNDNWGNMIETVMTLASNVGHEAEENTIGTISKAEAKEALRKHKGNIWAAVTECVEGRQQKYDELQSKGNFSREDIVTMLTAHEGNVDAAFQELNKAQLKPFLMRIWGQAENAEGSSEATNNAEEAAGLQADNEDGEAFEDAPEETPGVDTDYQPGNILKNIEIPPKADAPQQASAEQLKFERQVRRYLAEGKVKSFEEGELVVKLLEQEYPEEDVFLVIKETSDFDQAVKLIRQDCELCAEVVSLKDVIKMPHCDHSFCKDCATNFFTIVVTDQNISQAVCPFCREPSNLADDDDVALDYYAKLDQILKDILDKDTHDLFQRKLRDRTLMKDPNFKWCYKCPFGFLADPKNKKLVCPDCRAMSCAKCLVPWEPQHEGISCEDFARWKEENNPDRQAAGLEEHLAEHGISCPACNFRYTLTKGGCMHFCCTQCKFEFCIGCNRPFKMGTKCGKEPGCAKLGLHAHHPRNCLFYLRDKEPADLQKLLKTNNVEYLTEAKDGVDSRRCRVQVQKETPDGMVDGVCDEEAPKGFAGNCKIHYVEYLCGLVIKEKLEVVSLMELGEVKAVFTRAGKFIPRQRPGEYEFKYLKRLAEVVQQEIPLDAV